MIKAVCRTVAYMTGIIYLTLNTAWAVTLEVDLVSEGEPVPQAEIVFETEDGEEIDVVLITELDSSDSTQTDDSDTSGTDQTTADPDSDETTRDDSQTTQPSDSTITTTPKDSTVTDTNRAEDKPSITTDETGKLVVSFGDQFLGKKIYLVLKNGDKSVKRESVLLKSESNAHKVDVPAIALAVTHDKAKNCTIGSHCTFNTIITNQSLNTYKGPLIVENEVSTSASVGKVKEWNCQNARRGQSLCLLEQAEIEPGESVLLPLSLKMNSLPNSKNRNRCARIFWPQMNQPLADSRQNIQLAQLGTNAKGYKAGRADGVMGPKTKAAFQQLLNNTEQENKQMEFNNLMIAIGWEQLLRQTSFIFSQSCHQMTLIQPRRAVSKNRTTARRAAPKSQPKQHSQRSEKNRKILKSIAIGVGINLLKGKKKDKHHGHHY